MKVLVTGSAGRVGAFVVRRLIAGGHQVRGFDLRSAGIEDRGFDEVIGAFDDREAAIRACEGTDAVLHLGAFMSWLASDRDKLFRANVEGTRIVLEAAAAAKVGRFVFASSGEVYPENKPEFQPITEDHPKKPLSPYGLTKLLGEELVTFQGRVSSMETVILRFSHTQNASELLDPESFFSGPRFFLRPKIKQQENLGNKAAADLLRAADPGRPALVLTRNEEGRPFRMHITDTRDMAQGVLLALTHQKAAGGIFNLGATEPVDFAEILPVMAQKIGLPLLTVDLPGPGVWYHTSNQRMRETLGFEPDWPIMRMLDEAVAEWTTRQA
ncbi:Nucleoside-diphosphate-sugar epimerase [Sinorhizobium meliloti CCNWSX0020]|uniref:Nucleoside-diphosphate-sugar epimerase n=1 Tax=Sinorhizobium meliloti CCNWSX0020 TaxID=1107881 RepID=H0G4L3_RHIML|nr:NAD(P)-dependent oxidoreductase [Sinorhizobium meliloti]EHK75723.1 Nucleoside-diphosphate-sugar epimerase [Sinorhizobium meliloti CCNWSX0020]QGJ76652.1 NAD(P)-dependent oxidoreductase [Sinorhizobium meliloti]RVE82383.1 NAD(P)-dependent oxidoreductase [Sinorhizobium meliloti]RVE89792.1 NAD(P)-dependent oxidoreductase [Sinorhizobium meliloti]RVG59976.1 NAD(P)-dependent oxidoreductase [Sinorhizobium meliloti]